MRGNAAAQQRTFLRIRLASAGGAGKRRKSVCRVAVPHAALDKERRRRRRKKRMYLGAATVNVCHAAASKRVPQDLFEDTADAGHATRGHRLYEAHGVFKGRGNDGYAVGFVHVTANREK